MWLSWSEPQAEREPVTSARWKWRNINVSSNRLISEVADLRIHAGVIGVRPQIATTDAQVGGPYAPSEARHDGRRQLDGQRQLAQLHEGRVLHVYCGLFRKQPQTIRALGSLQSPVGDRVGVVDRVLA